VRLLESHFFLVVLLTAVKNDITRRSWPEYDVQASPVLGNGSSSQGLGVRWALM